MDLQECRKEIDRIDQQILDLLSERMAVTGEVAAYKAENGLPVLDAVREQEKILALQKAGEKTLPVPLTHGEVEELFTLIMKQSKRRQKALMNRGE